MSLEGRRAVITGAGRGIGAAIARALTAAGARAVLAARTESEVAAVARAIRSGGGDAFAVTTDVTDPSSVDALAAAAREHLGGVDVLVNNAGASASAPLHRETLEQWNRLMAVNATGTFLCTRAFLPEMVGRGWGRIVNVASVAGLHGARYISAYTAAKHAVVGFTRAVAAEAAPHGVTVNAVCPGYVDTPMTEGTIARIQEKTGRSREDAVGAILASMPQGRLIEPGEVAAAVVYLCGAGARGVNGQTIVIDGGRLT